MKASAVSHDYWSIYIQSLDHEFQHLFLHILRSSVYILFCKTVWKVKLKTTGR